MHEHVGLSSFVDFFGNLSLTTYLNRLFKNLKSSLLNKENAKECP